MNPVNVHWVDVDDFLRRERQPVLMWDRPTERRCHVAGDDVDQPVMRWHLTKEGKLRVPLFSYRVNVAADGLAASLIRAYIEVTLRALAHFERDKQINPTCALTLIGRRFKFLHETDEQADARIFIGYAFGE